MGFLSGFLPYIQVVVSLLLIAAILLQSRGSGLGGAFGNDEGSTFYTRRGGEKMVFQATIVLGIVFALSAFAALVA
jgi:protein translocase SecG subunit